MPPYPAPCAPLGAAQVADFNLSRLLAETSKASSQVARNPSWLAPEAMGSEPAQLQSDVFSFGVVLWELLTLELPWQKVKSWEVCHGDCEKRREPPRLRPPALPSAVADILCIGLGVPLNCSGAAFFLALWQQHISA